MKKIFLFASAVVFLSTLVFETLKAFDDGFVNLTRRRGNTEGCTCHGFSASPQVQAFIDGPSSVRAGDTVEYSVRITGGPLVRAGIDISAANGSVILSSSDTTLKRVLASANVYELTHRFPKQPLLDTVIFVYKYIAPNTPGSFDTLYATANSVNHDTTDNGDMWNFADDRIISITSSINIRNITSTAADFTLEQNYPNPFNPETKIRFSVPALNRYSITGINSIRLAVYDMLGKEVSVLVNGNLNPGKYEVTFDGSKYPSGMYFYVLSSAGSVSTTKKMMLLK